MSRKIVFHRQLRLPFEEFEEEDVEAEENSSYGTVETDLMESRETGVADGQERLHFISFGSGSSGNSCYIGTDKMGLIVDAGIRADKIEEKMKSAGLSMSHVKALLLTHDHSDHVRYAYNLIRTRRNMSLYCTPRVLNGILRRHNISKRIKDYHTPIFKEIPFKIGPMEITAFDVPHDGSDNMGFYIEYAGHKFALATDLGEVSARAEYYMSRANYIVIEANYDSEMLRTGRYPEYLKARIRAGNGHMDNEQTAEFLSRIVNPELKYVFLCHLSQDNNTPERALKCVRESLEKAGIVVGNAEETLNDRESDLQLMALPRFDSSRRFVFRLPLKSFK